MFLDANIFGPLIDVFQGILQFFHSNLGVSWGWSIILLTVAVRGVMMPLAFKQFQSMRRLQVHQPEMKAIQKRYKGDKQRQQQEMMKFYKENNVNPLSSCLPLVLQLPVFVALFYMLEDNLRKDICPATQLAYQHHYAITHGISAAAAAGKTIACGAAAHGAGFLFIPDITNQAHGIVLVVLLVLYVGTQMVSTLIMAGPTMDDKQRKMMLIMPVVFVIFIIRFPAGLIVYWVASNGWTMGQQFVLKQVMGPPPAPPTPVEGDGESEGLGAQLKELVGKLAGSGPPGTSRGNGGAKRARETAGARGTRSRGTRAKAESGARPSRAPGGPPPPSPRKKKKRSGRRR